MAKQLLACDNVDITVQDNHTEAYRIERDGPGVFFTKSQIDNGVIFSVTLLEKDPNHSDYILSGKQMVRPSVKSVGVIINMGFF